MLVKLLEDGKPDRIAVAFDKREDYRFRNEQYAGYKASVKALQGTVRAVRFGAGRFLILLVLLR